MSHDEALGLAQILLGLMLFTVGIPALIIETRVDESLRHILHKRIRSIPMLVLGLFTLFLVVALIFFTGEDVGNAVETLLRTSSAVIILLFAVVWFHIYMNVRITLVIKDVVREMKARLRSEGTISKPDLSDLLTLGENLEGNEKGDVILAVGELIRIMQARPEYNGTRLEALIRGLPRIVEKNGTLEHHNSAIQVITRSWETLVSKNFTNDKDALFIENAAGALGSLAVSRRLESVALRWVSAFSLDLDVQAVIGVPYRIGAAAVSERQYSVAAAALSRLKLIAARRERLPNEFIALVAYFNAAGPSAGLTARHFLSKLEYSPADVRAAAENAAAEFRENGDYTTADAIGYFLEVCE